MLGDSITERNLYTHSIAEATSLRVINAGLGATTMGAHGSWALDPFSFERLASSYASGDLSEQRTLLDSGRFSYSASFAANVAKLETLAIQDVDIVTIAYGTNDYIGRKPPGTASDQTTSTFAGDLNRGIRALQAANPDLEIILYTPPWRWNPASIGGGDAAQEPNAQGIYLSQFAQVILNVGQSRGFAVVDVYNKSGISKSTYSQYLADGVHLNAAGYTRTNSMLLDLIR